MQPRVGPIELALDRESKRRPLGVAHNAAYFHEDLRSTLSQLETLVATGALARLRDEEFEIEYRFDAVADWRDFVDRPKADRLEVNPALLANAERTLAEAGCSIVAVEAQVATAFRKPEMAAL